MRDAGALLEGIKEWVAIESPTAEPARVTAMMARAQRDFDAAGLVTERIPGRDGRGDHMTARTPWGGDGPGILVLSHLDTVHPVGTIDGPLPYRIDGDRAYGPGIYDMKASAYLGLMAYAAIAEAGNTTPLPIRWVVTGDEETGSQTSQALIEEAGALAKHVLVTEPARDGGCCVTARKGTARFTIRFHGRPAHSGGRHAEGRSAIREMARHILDLEALTDYDAGFTTNIGIVRGGTTMNTVPEHAEMTLDARLMVAEQGDMIIERVKSLRAYDPDVEISFEGGLDRPPFTKSEATTALFEHAKTLAAEIGFELNDSFSGGGSDGNFLAATHPVLDGLGVDGDGAHTMEEHLLISSLVPRCTLLKRLYETLS